MAKTFDLSRCKVGQYTYAPHYCFTGVWKCTFNDGKGNACGQHIEDFATVEEAKEFVYRMNGWAKKVA